MSLIYVLLVLMAVGVLLYLFNTYVTMIDAKFKKLINVVAIVGAVIWILYIFGIWDKLSGVTIHKI